MVRALLGFPVRRSRSWPGRIGLTPVELAFAILVFFETFLFLAREDRWEVLFYVTGETWPYIAFLWVKDIALSLLAAAAFAALVGRTARLERTPPAAATRGILAVALVAAGVGIALRFLWPEMIPPGLWFDPPFEARALLLKPEGLPWIGGAPLHDDPAGAGNRELVSYVYLHFYDAVFRVFGRAEAGFGALSAVPGALAIPAAAWFAWEVSGGLAAGLATSLVALGLWPLVFSRWGYTAAALIPLAFCAAAATLAALRTRRVSFALLGGSCIGLSLHTHSSSWAVAAGLGVFSLALIREEETRRLVFAGWLAAGLAFLPFGMGYLRNPANIGGRIRDVPAGSRVSGAYGAHVKGPLAVPADVVLNGLDYAGVLVWTPDPNPRDGVPGRAALHPLFGIVALAGFARAAARRTRADVALLALAAGSLAAGVFSNPGGAPNTIRTCVFVPAALVAAAGVLATWASALARRFPVRPGAVAAGFAAAVLVLETRPFVSTWPGHPAVLEHFCVTETSAARLVRNLGPGDLVLEPAALRFAFVFDALYGPTSARVPMVAAARLSAAALAASPPERPFTFVARRESLGLLSRAGFRVGRGVAPNESDPLLVLTRVAPPGPRP
jgi:hypothetical protein